ncbi:hypothetical protein GRI43_10695 [Altererythrobacter luteolus]|uniref:Uncharacterized protein n=1 Tax=Pontixanthobacter luteolus TaxID=295089 RepID=A0A6I4V4R3_9SPHN|nr:hypothetical protein [Pontixanthobacter luteolus]MXP47850.1 hypothetical protein [Pontixanthobacter luteolus]
MTTDNQKNIAEVNHWRGQCLDNFARVERAVISAIEHFSSIKGADQIKLTDTAGSRTRHLRDWLRKSNDPNCKKLAARLDRWSLRERERNEFVHGCFTIRAVPEGEWVLINEVVQIKKGVRVQDSRLYSKAQTEAFLQTLRAERTPLIEELELLKKAVA